MGKTDPKDDLIVTFRSATGVGSIPRGLVSYSISNIGGADGLINTQKGTSQGGKTLKADQSFNAGYVYDGLNPGLRTYDGMSYDASGTEFLIAMITDPTLND